MGVFLHVYIDVYDWSCNFDSPTVAPVFGWTGSWTNDRMKKIKMLIMHILWVSISIQLLWYCRNCTQLSDVLVTSRSSLKNYQEYNKTQTDGQNYQPQRDLVLLAFASSLCVCVCKGERVLLCFCLCVCLFLCMLLSLSLLPQAVLPSSLPHSRSLSLSLHFSPSFPSGCPGLVPLPGYLVLAYFSQKSVVFTLQWG